MLLNNRFWIIMCVHWHQFGITSGIKCSKTTNNRWCGTLAKYLLHMCFLKQLTVYLIGQNILNFHFCFGKLPPVSYNVRENYMLVAVVRVLVGRFPQCIFYIPVIFSPFTKQRWWHLNIPHVSQKAIQKESDWQQNNDEQQTMKGYF